MMRTSATGRADRAQAARRRAASGSAKRKAGFTLVELMVTIAVIGLAAGAVVLSMPDPRPAVGVEAEQFAARLARAREEAIMTNRPVAVEADGSGYRFAQFDGATWTPLNGVFTPRTWAEGVAASAGPVRIVFDPTGIADPAQVRLSRDEQVRTISIDGAGEVSING